MCNLRSPELRNLRPALTRRACRQIDRFSRQSRDASGQELRVYVGFSAEPMARYVQAPHYPPIELGKAAVGVTAVSRVKQPCQTRAK